MGMGEGDDFHGTQSNPYAAPTAAVGELAPPDGLRKADRLTRLLAVFIDGLVVSVPAFGLAIGMAVYMGSQGNLTQESFQSPLLIGVVVAFVLYVLGFTAYQIYWLWKNGQTLGKKLMKVRIVRSDGAPAELWRLLVLRYLVPMLAGAVPFVGGLFSLADPLFIFGDEKRCLHDLLADTIVVNA